jgi:AraC-like DNA-binding protein/quercetin dioxygenase-like cupin family protein
MKDYFTYLPDRETASLWGSVTTSVGYTRVPSGHVYPLQRHPVDHHFTWAQGRVLHAYQIIFISEGTGFFESKAVSRRYQVKAGTLLLLFPGIWHRYMPNQETGWVEHWMECRGPAFDRAVKGGLIRPRRAVLETGLDADILFCFERCHALAQRGALANQDALSTLGLHLLSVVGCFQRQGRGFEIASDDRVQRALALIALRCQETLNLPVLASELGIGYSRFRQAFKNRTGISPKQYQLQIRLQKARDLLANTDKSIKEIAEILGFESAFHLSKQFKQRMGVSPNQWRDK